MKTVPCRACGKPMVWLKSKSTGRAVPVNADTALDDDVFYESERHVSHFADCPKASTFRKERK